MSAGTAPRSPVASPEVHQDAVVRTRGLSKRYGARYAVENLEMDIRRGEVYGFLGPNGAGKTTTLRMLLGLIRPTSGTAEVLGTSPGHPDGLARVGALVESPAFYPYLSGRDNLRVMARYSSAPPSKLDEALELVDLSSRARDKYKSYSLGMKQRLGVAAALLKDPELLILDEPTNGLDPAGMAEMRALVRTLGRGDRTVLLSSHLLGEVEQICDRVGVIQRGRMIAEGTLADLRGTSRLIVRAEPLDLARQVAQRAFGPQGIEVRDGALVTGLDPRDAPRLARELVAAGIDLLELRSSQQSLEEAFLNLTEHTEHKEVTA
ncbi:MAG: ABC transporter ATP-binding protein [Chloroflexota bacterium]|nr:ABC transporter ATP-binding protein [Chloroflexota bacterium]